MNDIIFLYKSNNFMLRLFVFLINIVFIKTLVQMDYIKTFKRNLTYSKLNYCFHLRDALCTYSCIT